MGLPTLKKCCRCFPLEGGCVALAIIAIAACTTCIVLGSWNLPHHRLRHPEDNLISMSTVMFATFSTISNFILLAGIYRRRSGYVKLSLLFNLLFMVFGFLVAVVTCLFSPEFNIYIGYSAVNVGVTVVALILGAVFCFYYALVINSVYRRMKMDYLDTAIPV